MTASLSREPAIYRSLPELIAMLEAILLRHGTSDSVARALATNCASAERDGSRSHGLFRMGGYVSNLKSGFVDGRAVPQIRDAGTGFLRADAGNGYARPALEAAMPQAIDKARSAGACVLAIGNAHHNGPLWLDVEPFAEAGLIALSVVNSVTYVVLMAVTNGSTEPIRWPSPCRAPMARFSCSTRRRQQWLMAK